MGRKLPHEYERETKMKENTKNAISNYSTAKQRQYEQIYGTGFNYTEGLGQDGHKSQKFDKNKNSLGGNSQKHSMTTNYSKTPIIGDPKKVIITNNIVEEREEFSGTGMSDSFAANDREMTQVKRDECEDTFAANDR